MTHYTATLAGRLIKNGLRFQFLKSTGRPGKPLAVSLELTHHCIARCIMCNIWKIPRDVPNLSIQQWLEFLSSNLFSELTELDLTGGEPFLIKDLPDFIKGVCTQKQHHLKSLKSIAVTTNGFLTRRILDGVDQSIQRLSDEKIDLVVVCALDAVGPLHEKIRNVKNAWPRVNETIRGLIRRRKRYSNLIIGLKTTILPINVGELEAIADYADENGLFTIISPCILTRGRYLNVDRGRDLTFSAEDIRRMIRFYRKKRDGWSYHGDQMIRYLQSGAIRKVCSCGFNYFFVRSNGELFLCPLMRTGLGNITKTPATALLSSKMAARWRRGVGRHAVCRRCTEPGLERYSLPYQGFRYLLLLFQLGPKRFLQLHRHMGLDKHTL